MDWKRRVRAAFGARVVPDDDVVEELAQHAAAAFEAARADGCDPDEAARLVDAQVAAWCSDDVLHTRRRRRSSTVEPPQADSSSWAGLGGDVRYAVNLLRRQWVHTLVVVLTLALGIGASNVLFSVVYGVLVRPLPWPGADRLVRVTETRQGSTRPQTFMTNATYLAWSDHPATIETVAAWSAYSATMTGAGDPERIRVVEASPSLFTLLGGRPSVGQPFALSAGRAGDASQILLSHALWQQRFGGRRDVVGRALQMDGVQYTIVGVMPPEFAFPDREVRAYVPFFVPPVGGTASGGGTLSMFRAVARLKPGVTSAQAAAEATSRGRSAPDPGLVTMAVFGSRGPVQVSAVPLIEALTGEVRPALLILLAAVGLLLLTATANIASLQLARATGRRRETAIRGALGASGARLVRQLLVESAIVGQLGGVAGLALAAGLIRAVPSMLPADFPRLSDIALDWRVGVLSVCVAGLASLAFGLAPAVQSRRLNLVELLAEGGLAPVGGGGRTRTVRARLLIMGGQIAVASVLLVGTALLAQSFVALVRADRGFNPVNVLTARLAMPDAAYTPQRRMELIERTIARLKAVPGVTAAAYSSRLPLAGGREALAAFPVPARRGGGGTVSAHASLRHVSPGYFEALGARVVEGRGFTGADMRESREVVVVNRAFARQYLDTPAVGTRLPAMKGEREVVGVIANVSYGAAGETVQPELYITTSQMSAGLDFDEVALLVRTTTDPVRVAPILRSLVREQDSSLAIESVMTMEDRVWTSVAKPRLYTLLLGGFAAFALAIAGVGLFGVLSYSVSLRSREIGVRTSLGATPSNIVGLVLQQGLAVTLGGLAVGLAASAALARYVSRLLYGVTAYDTASFVVVPVLLIVVALVACAVPARRAARVDPARVLR